MSDNANMAPYGADLVIHIFAATQPQVVQLLASTSELFDAGRCDGRASACIEFNQARTASTDGD